MKPKNQNHNPHVNKNTPKTFASEDKEPEDVALSAGEPASGSENQEGEKLSEWQKENLKCGMSIKEVKYYGREFDENR